MGRKNALQTALFKDGSSLPSQHEVNGEAKFIHMSVFLDLLQHMQHVSAVNSMADELRCY